MLQGYNFPIQLNDTYVFYNILAAQKVKHFFKGRKFVLILTFLQSYQQVSRDSKNGTDFALASWCIITINSFSRKMTLNTFSDFIGQSNYLSKEFCACSHHPCLWDPGCCEKWLMGNGAILAGPCFLALVYSVSSACPVAGNPSLPIYLWESHLLGTCVYSVTHSFSRFVYFVFKSTANEKWHIRSLEKGYLGQLLWHHPHGTQLKTCWENYKRCEHWWKSGAAAAPSSESRAASLFMFLMMTWIRPCLLQLMKDGEEVFNMFTE